MSLAAFGALAGAVASSPAAAATIISVGTLPPANPYFYLTNGNPFSPSITANFGATIEGPSTSFDDIFQFTIPQNGTGSGSLSTSFTAPINELTISEVLIDGVSHPVISSSGGQSLTVSGIPIHNGVMNTIEVEGVTSSSATAATYTGTATFAAAVPEPASWALMIGGLGLVGGALRRRRENVQFA